MGPQFEPKTVDEIERLIVKSLSRNGSKLQLKKNNLIKYIQQEGISFGDRPMRSVVRKARAIFKEKKMDLTRRWEAESAFTRAPTRPVRFIRQVPVTRVGIQSGPAKPEPPNIDVTNENPTAESTTTLFSEYERNPPETLPDVRIMHVDVKADPSLQLNDTEEQYGFCTRKQSPELEMLHWEYEPESGNIGPDLQENSIDFLHTFKSHTEVHNSLSDGLQSNMEVTEYSNDLLLSEKPTPKAFLTDSPTVKDVPIELREGNCYARHTTLWSYLE